MVTANISKPKLGVGATMLSLLIGTVLLWVIAEVLLWTVHQLTLFMGNERYAVALLCSLLCAVFVFKDSK